MNRHTRRQSRKEIQHHHLLLRLELRTCPEKTDKSDAELLIHQIVKDIHMKLLAPPHVYYVEYPRYNEGLTAIAPIETSHIAFHFWLRPDRAILHNAQSRCLLEFDVYTCGTLTMANVRRILHHLTQFHPTHADVTLLNRNTGLHVERHLQWDVEEGGSWRGWVDSEVRA